MGKYAGFAVAALAAASCILEIREAKAEAGLSEHDGICVVHIITQHGATPESNERSFPPNGGRRRGGRFCPCRRCQLDSAPLSERYAAKVTEPCRLIEGADAPPTLAELAKTAGLSV